MPVIQSSWTSVKAAKDLHACCQQPGGEHTLAVSKGKVVASAMLAAAALLANERHSGVGVLSCGMLLPQETQPSQK